MQEPLHRPAIQLARLLERAVCCQILPSLDVAFSRLYAFETGANQLFSSDFAALELGHQRAGGLFMKGLWHC
jgi:hypothetical protein